MIAGLLAVLLLCACTKVAAHPDPSPIALLKQRAVETHTDTLIVYQDARPLLSWTYGAGAQRPIALMSATKSLCGLAIGMLIDDHRIRSVNEPLVTYFPQWHGQKRAITLREVLSQTSGLGDDEVAANTIVQASNAKLMHRPGKIFAYSNIATNLVAAVIRTAAGQPVDLFLQQRLFAPLGIKSAMWQHDQSGNAPCFAGAAMNGDDLEKIAELMLSGGAWHGKRLISRAWIETSTRSSQNMRPDYGLLWWLRYAHETRTFSPEAFAQWERAGVPRHFIDRLRPFRGKTLDNATYQRLMQQSLGSGGWSAFLSSLQRLGVADTPLSVRGEIIQYSAEGYMGQALIVVPAKRLVVVRQISPEHYGSEKDSFFDLWQYVARIL